MTARRPITFSEFLAMVGAKPTPAQSILWRIATGETQPRDLQGEERRIADELFGGIEEVSPRTRKVVSILKGSRAGISWLTALRLCHLGLVVPARKLAPGEPINLAVIGPTMAQAGPVFAYIVGAFESVPALRARIVERTKTTLDARRDDGRIAHFEVVAAARGGRNLRGKWYAGVACDEASYFESEDHVANAEEIHDAVRPRILAHGQLLIVSTPYVPSGLIYSLHSKCYGVQGAPSLAARAPTALLRSDDAEILADVEALERTDPDVAAREYGCAFLTMGSSAFLDSSAIENAIESYALPAPRRGRIAVGADPAFKSDAAALVVAGMEGDTITILAIDEVKPKRGEPLQPSSLVKRWAQLIAPYGATAVHGDVHYFEAMREHFQAAGIRYLPIQGGSQGKVASYSRFRSLLHEGRIRLPNHDRFLEQLRAVTSRPLPGGSISITSPRTRGGHGDILSAAVAAVYALAKPGTLRGETRRERRRAEAAIGRALATMRNRGAGATDDDDDPTCGFGFSI